jgi:hypothetical protein
MGAAHRPINQPAELNLLYRRELKRDYGKIVDRYSSIAIAFDQRQEEPHRQGRKT